jgi:F-type H+-transporting ATPase subunit gamma
MGSLRDIRKRIRSVKNTRQITKAMKMVSAAKLRKAQEGVVAARPYARTLDGVIEQLMSRSEPGSLSHPLLVRREVKKIDLVVLTSDRGLAGGFNSNINRRALRFLQEHSAKHEVAITTLGRKGNEFLRGRGYSIRKDYPGAFARVTWAGADAIAQELAQRFLAGDCDAVYVMFNEFASAVTQVPTTTQLLPFEPPAAERKPGLSLVDYEYEPDAATVLEKLLPSAVSVKLLRGMLESLAAEHAARMTAMENATRNAGDMIGSLTLFYNRSRQALITKELMEIVSGAEALRG